MKPDQVIVIDSSSKDGTADMARSDGFEVLEIMPHSSITAARGRWVRNATQANILIY